MARRQAINPLGAFRIVIALSAALLLLSGVALMPVNDTDQFFGSRAPKIALPTLTCVAPNCTPTSKSELMPIERI